MNVEFGSIFWTSVIYNLLDFSNLVRRQFGKSVLDNDDLFDVVFRYLYIWPVVGAGDYVQRLVFLKEFEFGQDTFARYYISSPPISKIHLCGNNTIITKSDTSPFSITAILFATFPHSGDATI